MRTLLAACRAGGASHCRSASSNRWLGCVGNTQLRRFQCAQHFRTHGGPNYSLKSDRCGVACGTIMRSRPQRPLSSTVRPRNQFFPVYHARRSVWHFASPVGLVSTFALVVARFRWLARCSRLSSNGAPARSCAHCSRIGALAAQATAARLRRTAGSVTLAVVSSVVSNARGIPNARRA